MATAQKETSPQQDLSWLGNMINTVLQPVNTPAMQEQYNSNTRSNNANYRRQMDAGQKPSATPNAGVTSADGTSGHSVDSVSNTLADTMLKATQVKVAHAMINNGMTAEQVAPDVQKSKYAILGLLGQSSSGNTPFQRQINSGSYDQPAETPQTEQPSPNQTSTDKAQTGDSQYTTDMATANSFFSPSQVDKEGKIHDAGTGFKVLQLLAGSSVFNPGQSLAAIASAAQTKQLMAGKTPMQEGEKATAKTNAQQKQLESKKSEIEAEKANLQALVKTQGDIISHPASMVFGGQSLKDIHASIQGSLDRLKTLQDETDSLSFNYGKETGAATADKPQYTKEQILAEKQRRSKRGKK